MATTSAIITMVDDSMNHVQKTLTDLNPEATNAQIKTFAQKLTAITGNTYESTYRINRINCDTEADSSKTAATITITAELNGVTSDVTNGTLAGSGFNSMSMDGGVTVTVTASSGARVFISDNISSGRGAFGINNGGVYWGGLVGSVPGATVLTFYAPETDTYTAATATLTITE